MIFETFSKTISKQWKYFSSKERWERFFEKHEANMESFQEKPVKSFTKDATGDDITPCLQAKDVLHGERKWKQH